MTVEEIKAELKRLNKELEKQKLKTAVQPTISQEPSEKNSLWTDEWVEYLRSSKTSPYYTVGKPSGITGPYNWVTGEWTSQGIIDIDDDIDDDGIVECICVKPIYSGSFTVGNMYIFEIVDESSVVIQDNNDKEIIVADDIFNECFVEKIIII